MNRRAAPDRPEGAAPAYYARSRLLRTRALGDWWTLLHPPYTLWHLSYVTIGACLVGPVRVSRLLASLAAFFLAVGVAAHALDELRDRPLRTDIRDGHLVAAAVVGLAGAVALGIAGVAVVGPSLVPFVVVGVVVALGYNLELFGGVLHRDSVFALAWGGFPVLTGFVAQHATLDLASVLAAGFGCATAAAQRVLSTPARTLRRRTASVSGEVVGVDGQRTALDEATLLRPLELALRMLSWSLVLLGASLAVVRFSA